MDIIEALETVERAKETAEKIIKRAQKTDLDIGDCDEVEYNGDETVHFRFIYTSGWGNQYIESLGIPVDVINDPTEKCIRDFVALLSEEEAKEKAQQAAKEKLANKEAAIKNKKERFETYQKLKEEFSHEGE